MAQEQAKIQTAITDSFKFLSIQTKLFEVMHLLQKAYEESSKHRCYSRDFEIAYWQENQKLKEAISANKQLARQLEERTFGSAYCRPEQNPEGFHFEPFPIAFDSPEGENAAETPVPDIWLTENNGLTTKVCGNEDEEQHSVKLESSEEEELRELEKYIRLN
ncbi:hypothetical protein S7711_11289 [Stachybotrys chartarum IBT 7711]|uniref:Uncharacterized protein n=1 Tax=Stachybotrys chartarum (strain CBS 109288 / IBT 7711) TaxID=1280523 RepID=A0A084BCJ7_STACB|nr:hypothetical protein S7711_11289 [Stachybotrys chartarum IBT 7711]KFA78579.1 hypothetical protein S40288_11790 [Stachybotrys chartarum IBT 40288]